MSAAIPHAQTLDYIVGQPEAMETIRRIVASLNTGARPAGALFLVGPTGTGKTSTALALEVALLRSRVVEFNCAAMGGASLREQLEDLKGVVDWSYEERLILLLDEIDKLSKSDRIALRRPIEKLSDCVLVVLTANKELGDAGLTSRSIRIEFVPLDDDASRVIALRLAHAIGIRLSDTAVRWVVSKAKGDGRKIAQFVRLAPVDEPCDPVPVTSPVSRDPGTRGGRPREDFDLDLAARLRVQGWSWSRVAKAVGAKVSTVRRRLAEMGRQNPAGTLREGVLAGGSGRPDGDLPTSLSSSTKEEA